MFRKLFFGFIALFVLNSCLDSYTINIDGYEDLLVVDGLITDENKSHAITLLRSTSDINEDSPYETGAEVYVTDTSGEIYYFTENSSGVYSSDSTDLLVEVGEKYILHIQTEDGESYQSDECEVLPKIAIDSVYYKKDSDWDESGEYLNDGISFYMDATSETTSTYVRFLYDEDWEFRTPYPEGYVVLEDGTIEYISPVENWLCYKHDSSSDINVYSFGNQAGSEIKEKEVCFVASSVSDRLSIRYCLTVKQLAISKEEYEYWRKLSESTEETGEVFAKQPYSVAGNVYNTENENEAVLGFFQVGSVASKRLYVSKEDLKDLDLPAYSSSCESELFLVDDKVYYSIYEIYEKKVINGGYYVYELKYDEMGMSIIGLLLARKKCSDCTLTGNSMMPDFWEE